MNKKLALIAIIMILISVISIALAQSVAPEPYDIECDTPLTNPIADKAWLLQGDTTYTIPETFNRPRGRGTVAVVIIPEPICSQTIQAAWSYAVRYSADGLDLPNYEAAVELMLERHPTWQASVTQGWTIGFDAQKADLDVPETEDE